MKELHDLCVFKYDPKDTPRISSPWEVDLTGPIPWSSAWSPHSWLGLPQVVVLPPEFPTRHIFHRQLNNGERAVGCDVSSSVAGGEITGELQAGASISSRSSGLPRRAELIPHGANAALPSFLGTLHQAEPWQ